MGFLNARSAGAILLSGLFCHTAHANESKPKLAAPPSQAQRFGEGADIPYAQAKAIMLADHWIPALLGRVDGFTMTVWRRDKNDAAVTLSTGSGASGAAATTRLVSSDKVVTDVTIPTRPTISADYVPPVQKDGGDRLHGSESAAKSLMCSHGKIPSINVPAQPVIMEMLSNSNEDITIRADADERRNWSIMVIDPTKNGCLSMGASLYVNDRWALQMGMSSSAPSLNAYPGAEILKLPAP